MTDHVTRSLYLRTFGRPALLALSDGGGETTLLEPSKVLALLVYITLAPGRSVSRDRLIDLLWAHLEPDAARHALRHHLWQLRRKISPTLIVDTDDHLSLRTALPSDFHDFNTAVAKSRFAEAIRLYTGEFFPYFAAAGSAEFERWVEVERVHLRSRFLLCAESVIRAHLDSGKSRDAIPLAIRARDAEPTSQHGWRLLLETYIAAGDRFNAKLEAEALTRSFADQETELEPSTRSLLNTVARMEAPSATTDSVDQALHPEHVGREREFATLLASWDGASKARGECVYVTAPGGLGKSRLLDDFRARLQSLRAKVVFLRAQPGAQGIDGTLAADLVGSLAALPGARGVAPEAAPSLAHMNPIAASTLLSGHAPGAHPPSPSHMRLAVLDLLAAVSEDRPIAVLIDDLHWADRSSRELIEGVAGSLAGRRILMVIAERPEHSPSPFLGSTHHVPLHPLPVAAVATLLESLAALPLDAWADRLPDLLRESTGGSPLLILETLQLAITDGLLDRVDGEWVIHAPDRLEALIHSGAVLERRLSTFPPLSQDIVVVLALAGTTLHRNIVAAALGGRSVALEEALLPLLHAGIVIARQQELVLAHDEMARAALMRPQPARLQSLRLTLGQAIGESSATEISLRQAGMLVRKAGNDSEERTFFVRWVRMRRAQHDHRSLATLAAEWLGQDATLEASKQLVSRLSVKDRLHFAFDRRSIGAVAAAGVIVSVILSAGLQSEPPTPDLDLVAAVLEPEHQLSLYRVPLFSASWRGGDTIRLNEGEKLHSITMPGVQAVLHPPNDSLPWVLTVISDDSMMTDLWALEQDGTQHRITNARGDDVHPAWSPDGRSLVFATSRWDDKEHKDIAILDFATGAVRRLTSTPQSEVYPHWSPDGTRIAFNRDHSDTTAAFCSVFVDATALRCRVVRGDGPTHLLGWHSPDSLLLAIGSDLALLGADSGGQPIRRGLRQAAKILAASRAGLIVVPSGGSENFAAMLHENPEVMRPLLANSRTVDIHLVSRLQPAHLSSIALTGEPPVLTVGVPFVLALTGVDARGMRQPLTEGITLTSESSDALRVASDGSIVVSRPGTFSVRVSAGGWRDTTIQVHARERSARLVLSEQWKAEIPAPWKPYGQPRPLLKHVDGVTGIAPHGDGRFVSGVYRRLDVDATQGISLRTSVLIRVTAQQWQVIKVGVVAGLRDDRVANWDHRTGYFLTAERLSPQVAECQFRYPVSPEGSGYGDTFGVTNAPRSFPAPNGLRRGSWIPIELHWLPDGRCLVSLDEKVYQGRLQRLVAGSAVYLVIEGADVGTEALVGPLEIWEGVSDHGARAARMASGLGR